MRTPRPRCGAASRRCTRDGSASSKRVTEIVVVGVDGGGTKTHAVVTRSDGTLLGATRGGPSNWEMVGLDGARNTIVGAVRDALDAAGVEPARVAAGAFALAGCDWPSDHDRLAPVLAACGLGGPTVGVKG